jgi:hypothetical protein
VYEFNYPELEKPVAFSALECLKLNPGYAEGTLDPFYQQYFYGELVPPYIDVLGRGAHFRSSMQWSLLYQSEAKCYYNKQRYGSYIYQRMVDYFGPQFDIQTGYFHQGYGTDTFDGYFGEGSLFIDLPHARVYDPAYNCTRGFQLMNESKVEYNIDGSIKGYVYTDTRFDPYISTASGAQRKIAKGEDQWYRGTCEADIICDLKGSTEMEVCSEGFVCDEDTDSEEGISFLCREGYVCDFGTTPDTNLEAPMGQYSMLCPQAYYCLDGVGLGQAYRSLCPESYFCPSGTANPLTGQMVDDSVTRNLTIQQANPFYNTIHQKYLGDDDLRLLSDHDLRCLLGDDKDFETRYNVRWIHESIAPINEHITYLSRVREGKSPYVNDSEVKGIQDNDYYRPSEVVLSTASKMTCGRDHKWRHVYNAINRDDCQCENYFMVNIAVYRLWKCFSDLSIADLGIGTMSPPHYGGGDFWFERQKGTHKQCIFNDTSYSNLTLDEGYVPFDSTYHAIADDQGGLLDVSNGIELQVSWTTSTLFTSYSALKAYIEPIFEQERELVNIGDLEAIDPYVYDLYYAIQNIEIYGEVLKQFIWLEPVYYDNSDELESWSLSRLDMCECQRLLKCPNGTYSLAGSDDVYDCQTTKSEILKRINGVPSWYIDSNFTSLVNGTDYSELTGDEDEYLGMLALNALEEAVFTVDLTDIPRNMTYNEHYRIGVYVDCQPCPTRYQCNYRESPATCSTPSVQRQEEMFVECLQNREYWQPTCLWFNGSQNFEVETIIPPRVVECNTSESMMTYYEPDLWKCQQLPFFL